MYRKHFVSGEVMVKCVLLVYNEKKDTDTSNGGEGVCDCAEQDFIVVIYMCITIE